jgi:DNA replication protein DnaC
MTANSQTPSPATAPETAAPDASGDLSPEWQSEFLARQRLKQARIDARFLAKTFDTFKPGRSRKRKEVLQAARAFVQSFNFKNTNAPPRGLCLEGPVGCGKTHIAVAILKEIIEKGYTGLYYNMVDLLADIRATYDTGAVLSESEIIDEIIEPDLLVLDDLGAERTSGWVNERLYMIINRRYVSCKPVVVTTNLSLDELTEKLGERTASRLCEICEWFTGFPDEDYRKAHMR